jgi:hypothetical protein
MSNIEKVWVWSKNCIERSHVQDRQRNHDPVATMLFIAHPT